MSELTHALRTIARATLPDEDLTYGVFLDGSDALNRAVITLVTDAAGRPIAFNALSVMEVDLGARVEPVLHLGLVMVDPGARSKGLSWVLYGLTCILLYARGLMRPIRISNVTQVPAIVGMVSETFSDVYPTPDPKARARLKQRLLARGIMARHRHVFGVGDEAGFDETRFVITNAYTGGSDTLKKTFDEAPKHRDPVYNDFCAEALDYGRGDDVLQLGQIDAWTLRRYVFRMVPPGSFLRVVALLGLLALQKAILPVLQWFDTKHPFGELRGRG